MILLLLIGSIEMLVLPILYEYILYYSFVEYSILSFYIIYYIYIIYYCGDWGLGIGDLGLWIGLNLQSPISYP